MPDYYWSLETYIQIVLFVLLQLCFIFQLYYLVSNHSRLISYKPVETLPEVLIPVSVIISARNEAQNLQENLPFILEQNYHDFEVVVINDCSYDRSDEVLEDLQRQYPRLKVVTITEHDRFKTGKKFALTLGIKASKHEYLLFTDADCKPASTNWITRMVAGFGNGAEIVLGYSPYYKTSSFISRFTRFETLKTAMNYLSCALKGEAYMGIGRNLAYTKTLFFSAKGFASHMHILSGDDDLFVNQHATANNTVTEINPEAFTYTAAKTNWPAYFKQKKRHMSVGKLYKKRDRTMLSFDAISGFLFYILLILCFVFRYEPLLALGLWLFRLIVQLIIYNKIFKKLDGKDVIWYLPFFDFIYYMYLTVFGLVGALIKTSQWK